MNIEEIFNNEYFNTEKLWKSFSIKNQGVVYVFKFPNDYGLVVRRLIDKTTKPNEWHGFIDGIIFHDDHYFDRADKYKLTSFRYDNLQELLFMLKRYERFEKHESN